MGGEKTNQATTIPLVEAGDKLLRCITLIQTAIDLRCQRLLPESESTFRLALAIQPDNLEAQLGLATVLYRLNLTEEADQWVDCALRRSDAIRVLPTEAKLTERLLLATVDLTEQLRPHGRAQLADALIEQIIGLEPENEVMHQQFGMLLLRCGEFRHGWRERDKRVGPFSQPVWRGEPLTGKKILVQALHGFGDTIQFVRLLPLLKERGAFVILEHQPELATLLQGAAGWDTLIARRTGREAFGFDFDLHIPLMSLPDPLSIQERIPAAVPYLHPDPARVRDWQQRLSNHQKWRVGLVWAGNPDFKGDNARSCRLADYAWLAQLPQIQFYSLQKGEAAKQTAAVRRMDVIDLEPYLHDWADTAAAIMNLDLVITVDTAVAHLAGALGRPVWVLIRRNGCWRWLEEREDSPWYPSMRLFRQPLQDDWSGVLQNIIRSLSDAFPPR
jgi:hypothetical protein